MLDTTIIIAIIISNVVALAVVALVILLFYYHWRNQELLVNFSAFIRENLGDNYEIWFKHDILTALNVVANTEKGVLYAQGAIVPFHEIMEVRQGRKNLKLLTENSLYPYIIIDFDVQAVNPATGQKYKEEIAAKIEQQMR